MIFFLWTVPGAGLKSNVQQDVVSTNTAADGDHNDEEKNPTSLCGGTVSHFYCFLFSFFHLMFCQ